MPVRADGAYGPKPDARLDTHATLARKLAKANLLIQQLWLRARHEPTCPVAVMHYAYKPVCDCGFAELLEKRGD